MTPAAANAPATDSTGRLIRFTYRETMVADSEAEASLIATSIARANNGQLSDVTVAHTHRTPSGRYSMLVTVDRSPVIEAQLVHEGFSPDDAADMVASDNWMATPEQLAAVEDSRQRHNPDTGCEATGPDYCDAHAAPWPNGDMACVIAEQDAAERDERDEAERREQLVAHGAGRHDLGPRDSCPACIEAAAPVPGAQRGKLHTHPDGTQHRHFTAGATIGSQVIPDDDGSTPHEHGTLSIASRPGDPDNLQTGPDSLYPALPEPDPDDEAPTCGTCGERNVDDDGEHAGTAGHWPTSVDAAVPVRRGLLLDARVELAAQDSPLVELIDAILYATQADR